MHRWVGLGALLLSSALGCESVRPLDPPAPFPLDRRVPWTVSTVVGSPDPPLPFRARRAFPKLDFKQPLYLAFEPGTGRALVVELEGKIRAFPNDPSAVKTDLFFDRPKTSLYSLCFHPRHADNRWVYVFANGPTGAEPKKKDQILRYEVKEGRCDPATEHLVIEWTSNGHDGGEMAFGPDGMLYISAGDGTTDSDTSVTGQDLGDLASGVLRIDVEHPDPGKGYSIPKDNPFLSIPGARGELWAYGFRNPWRLCFDPFTGDLWVGDIGQDLWEMVEVVRKGDNYGWSVLEGGRPFHAKRALGPTPVVAPAIVHHHSEARSITGGFVYAGAKFPELRGAYLYSDYSTGRVWAARWRDGKIVSHREIADTPIAILGMAQDGAGEIYLVDYAGQVYLLDHSPPEPPRAPFPRTLSASGAFLSARGHRLHPGLIPYSVNSPLWSDGAHKERAIGLPGDSRIEFTEEGAWKFPEGTVLVKTFSLDLEAGNPASRRRIETRFLTLQQNEWAGYSYAWNDAETEAELVGKAGLQRELSIRTPGGVRRQTWTYPSRADCMVCHSRAAGFVLGTSAMQMNRDYDYGGGAAPNQLEALQRLGVFRVNLLDHVRAAEEPWRKAAELGRRPKPKDPPRPYDASLLGFRSPEPLAAMAQFAWSGLRKGAVAELEKNPRTTTRLPRRPSGYRKLADPADPSADLASRARSYLQANCAHCHVEAGGGNSAFDVHVATPPEKAKLVGAKAIHDTFGIADPLLVAPGSPERSMVWARLSRRGPGQMPPLASSIVDDDAVRLLGDWIRSLK